MIFPDLILWGLFSGFMGGLLGVGGGLVFVLVIPAALRQLGIPELNLVAITVANSLACTFFTTFAAGFKRFFSDSGIRRAASIIGISSTLVSLIVLKWIVNPGLLPQRIFDLFFLIIVAYLMMRLFLKWRKVKKEELHSLKKNDKMLLVTGFFSGFVSPLSGLGGGIVVVPLLHSMLNYPIRMAQSVSFGVIAISTLFSTLFNLVENADLPVSVMHNGLIVFPIVLSIAPAAVFGALAGSWISGKISPKLSGGILLGFLLFIFLRKIFTII